MQSIESIYQEIHSLPPKERQKLFEMLEVKQSEKTNGSSDETEKHFQETATDEEWSIALRNWATRPRKKFPSLSDEALRRENIYTREDRML